MKKSIVFITTLKPMRSDFQQFVVEHTNAIKSWQKLNCNKKIVVAGNDDGTAEFCAQYNCIHEIPEYKYGLPVLNSIVKCGYKHCDDNDFAIYINADIVIDNKFITFLELVEEKFPNLFDQEFYITSGRLDVEDFSIINFDDIDWMDKLLSKSVPSEFSAIDVMIHRKNMYANMPDYIIGRCSFDTWMNDYGCKTPVSINASGAFPMIHQFGKYYNTSGVIERKDIRKNLTPEEEEGWKHNTALWNIFVRQGDARWDVNNCTYYYSVIEICKGDTNLLDQDEDKEDNDNWITLLGTNITKYEVISKLPAYMNLKTLFRSIHSLDIDKVPIFQNYLISLFNMNNDNEAYYLYESLSHDSIKLLSGNFNGYMIEKYKNNHNWLKAVHFCKIALQNNYNKEDTYKLLHILGIVAYYADEKPLGKNAVLKAIQLYEKDIDKHNLTFYV